MKKLSLVVLALATALATAPAAMADTFNFTISGINGVDTNGTSGWGLVSGNISLTGNSIGGGQYLITSASITLNAVGITTGTQTGSLISTTATGVTADPGHSGYYFSPSGNAWTFDDIINLSNANHVDGGLGGLLFSLPGGNQVLIWYSGGNDNLADFNTGTSSYYPTVTDGYAVSLQYTPEPSSLLLMGTGLLLMAGFLFRQKALQGVL
jgi:hypothetical protein